MAMVIFWGAAILLLHAYVLYPLALFALDGAVQVARNARFMRQGRERRLREGNELPPVTLVVASAGDEAARMPEKLPGLSPQGDAADRPASRASRPSSLAVEYPGDRLEVLAGLDGETLNRCIPVARGEIVILSGPGARIDPRAVRKLVRHFEDPEVGAVCGKVKRGGRGGPGEEEGALWTYESLIKLYEGKFGAVMGPGGGLLAIRRRLFTALPAGTIAAELVIALRILENGYQVRYDPEAVAVEEAVEDREADFGRRALIAAGGFQSLRVARGLLAPAAGFRAFAFWSHLVLRWCAPALMALAFIANLFLLGSPVYRLVLAAQLLFYGLAAAGRAEWFDGALRRAAGVAYAFVKMNAATAVGFWRFLRSGHGPAWERTARA